MNIDLSSSPSSTMLVNNNSSDNPVSLASPSSFSSPTSSSSLFSSSTSITLDTSGDCYTLEAHLPLVKTNIEQLEKFQRLLTRLDTIYNCSSSMSTTTLPPPAAPHMQDRYLFRSLSNDNNPSRMSWSKKNKAPHANGSNDTPPGQRKRYKFTSSTNGDQNVNTNVYKFPNGQTETRSHSTGSNRYYFPPNDSTKKTTTFMRTGSNLEQRSVTFIGGATSKNNEKSLSASSNSITTDGPYLFSKPTDSSAEGPRRSTNSPERRSLTRPSPSRIDTVTSTNGSLSTLRRSPPNKIQNVRFDPSSTPRSYLNEARERLAGKKRGQSPQAFQKSVDRFVSSTNQKYRQQQILSPPLPFQQPSKNYVSQYYADPDEPAVDYPMDSDDEEPNVYAKGSKIYNPSVNRTHDKIMKNVNQSLIDRRYLSDTNRLKQLDQHVRSHLRSLENQALQRELTHDLIRCFSSTYLEDLRREENRHAQTRRNPRSYTYEDIQDIHMPNVLESYRTRHTIDRERRSRLTNSLDGAIAASTPTSSIGAGPFSPLLSLSSPIMTGSLTENTDAQSGGFEIDRRGTKSQSSTTVTPTSLRPGHMPPTPGLDLFYEIMQERFRGVDASIAGQVSKASQLAQQKDHLSSPLISPHKPTDHDSDSDTRSNSSFWLEDEEEGQQMMTNQQEKLPQHQRQISRYLSTVNRSLLDRPSDLVADFYISRLNRSMQESIRHVENIARDKAQSRQIRNSEFVEETTSKLGRSLSAEHLYQVRKEHFRYRQPFNAPTSFTAEDVADIYKPFALENFKRKIAIEFERRRRAREGQLFGTASPMYGSHSDVSPFIRNTQPPLLEIPTIPVVDRQSRLSRTAVLRQNEPGYSSSSNIILVPSPVVTPSKIPIGRARRTLTDDGTADVVHHIGKISPPPSVLIDQSTSPRLRTSIIIQEQKPRISTIAPPDFTPREPATIRQERAKSHITELPSDDLVDGALTSSQTTLFKDEDDFNPNLRKPVQIITSIETTSSPSARRPQAKIYTHSPASEPVRFCHADLIESDSGNYDLSMANVRSVLTLNHGEVRELNLVAHQAQRLQLPTQDYDRAMIMLSPEQQQQQQQHEFERQPLLLAAASIKRLQDETTEEVSRHVEQHPTRQHTMLITPLAEHMAKVEQDISVFENVSSAHLSPAQLNRLREIPVDGNGLLSPLSAEQPMVLRSSKINRVESLRESSVEQLPENDYYRRRLRAFDLLRHVDNDPNVSHQSIEQSQVQILENTTSIPRTNISSDRTRIVDDQIFRERQTIEHTDEPVIYETIDQTVLHRLPRTEQLSSSEVDDDQLSIHCVRQNQINMYQTPPRRSQEQRLDEMRQESVSPLQVDPMDQSVHLRSREEPQRTLEPPKRPEKKLIFNYGRTTEIPLSRSSSFGSDQELKNQSQNSARLEYDRRTLSSLDDITQPISHHPPTRTHRDQEHIAHEIEREPMALREETALENEVSYDGSLGRASLNRPIQSFNAPRELADSNSPALLNPPLPIAAPSTVLDEEHARAVIDRQPPFQFIESMPQQPTVIYDTDWPEERTRPLPNVPRAQIFNARYPPTSSQTAQEHVKIDAPQSVLLREEQRMLDRTNEEMVQPLSIPTVREDHMTERAEDSIELTTTQAMRRAMINDNQTDQLTDFYEEILPFEHSTESRTFSGGDQLYPSRSTSTDLVLCHPSISTDLQTPKEQTGPLADDSLLIRHQEKVTNVSDHTHELEAPVRSTATFTLHYPQQQQDINPPWQRVFDQAFASTSDAHLHENLRINIEEDSPRFLPSIASPAQERTLNYTNEFHQTPLLHENVRIDTTSPVTLLPSTQIQETRPIYRVRQEQLSDHDAQESAATTSIHFDFNHAETHPAEPITIQPPPIPIDIEIRVRPTYSETSSLLDMESFLNRFEESLEPEQHLPLIDQISLSYTTTLRSTQDETQRAIERYEAQHPYFSRALPLEWAEGKALPHDEQLMEQWIVERNLDTIQQQVESITNQTCEYATATATAASPLISERFEEERSHSYDQEPALVISVALVSHCSPTSDYETDSLDKDNETASTNTSVHGDTNQQPPHMPLLVEHSPKKINDNDNDSMSLHHARENEMFDDQGYLHLSPNTTGEQLLQLLFEPAHFQLPSVQDLSIYHTNIQQDFSALKPLLTICDVETSYSSLSDENRVEIHSPKLIISSRMNVEEYIHHNPHETAVLTTGSSTETTSFLPVDEEQQRQQARTRQESDHFASLAEQHYVEINIATPTPSMRRVHPAPYSRPGTFFEDITMERAVNANLGTTKFEHANVDQVHEHDAREYIATSSRDHSEHLPVQQLPIQHFPSAQRAHVIPSPDQSKSDEVLVLDRVIQHISEDEKSTSSEEVIFEEWSEEFPCQKIEEVDRRTNRVLRSEINQIGHRVKSDVIKEEYKEKNERIKGHKSYDIVKEVYRRIPSHAVDPSKHTIIPIDRSNDHVYEEIPAAVPHRDRKWSTEDIYTTEIVYDSDAVREYQQIDRNRNVDISTPPSSSRTYDRVRPGQYPPIPPPSQATVSTVPSSNYDRISSIVTPPSHYTDERRPSERDEVVSEEYTVEVEHRRSPTIIHPTPKYIGKLREETSEEENSDAYVITSGRDNTYQGLTTIIDQAGRRSSGARTSDWRNELKQTYARTSLDEDQLDQFGKQTNGNYVAQRVSIVPSSRSSQRFKDVQIKVPTREKTSSATEPIYSQASPSTTRHTVKEVLVHVSRGPSPEKHLQQQIYHIRSSSSDDDDYNENEQDRKPYVRAISIRSRDTTKKSPVVTPIQDDRPTPPKRSSSSSIIDERRAKFEQYRQEKDRASPSSSDQPISGRVGELKNAFESSTNGTTRDDLNRTRPTVSTSLTEERRRLFEQQQQQQQQDTSSPRRPATEYQLDERRISETHTVPSRLPDRAGQSPSPPDMKSTTRVQSTDRLGRTGFDNIKSSLESSINRTTEPQTSLDITIKSKQVISSVDSDLSGQSPPIHQSTPKSTKQMNDDDAGHESEDELSDPTSHARAQEQHQQQDVRRKTPKTRLRDFSQSTAQAVDSSYSSQRTRSTFNEENMENLLSHVPASKGKALLIELSPRPSHESPMISSKPARDPYKSLVSSDSGVFDYSTATSRHPTMSSSSWRNQASSTIIDEANRTSTVIRDSGAYADSPTTTPSLSARYGRRQTSDTDQTTIHGGDDSVSRSTQKYETEIVSNEPSTSRYVRRQITRSPPSEYENIANYHSGMNTPRKVPITTQSRSLLSTKPLVIDEYETVETETRVECQIQRTHEIKESTTRTEGTGSPHTPKKVVTTTTTTTTTTRSPETSSDEAIRTLTPARRVLVNERPQYHETIRTNGSPISVQKPHVVPREVRHEARFDSPPSDSLSYPTTFPTTTMPEEDSIRVEETLFKPIQRDRSHDSLLPSPTSRSNVRTLSAGPRTMEITSFSPQNQVTFGKYTPNEIIAIVRVPELANRTPQLSQSSHTVLRHVGSEPELNHRARQEEERGKLHYQRVHATSYNPPTSNQDYSARQSRSRPGPNDRSNDHPSPVNIHPRSSSTTPYYHPQTSQRRSGSLGNLLGANIEFEIEIEKRPPQQPEQPTTVALDQASRAIVTTSRDGRVSIQNIAARPGNTVVINSDFHSSDRSLNRSSGYFSSDELRSQGIPGNYSSDEQSSGAATTGQTILHQRRYRNNEQTTSRLPSHYRPKQQSTHYQQMNNDNFDRVNQIVHRYYQQSNAAHTNTHGFNEAIDQIDALYNNLDVQSNEEYFHDRLMPNGQTLAQTPITYDYTKPSTTNRRRQLSQNNSEYAKRYTSTGFQNMSPPDDQTQTNSTIRHLVSPPSSMNTNEKRRSDLIDSHRALSDNENLRQYNSSSRTWGSTSLNDLAAATPIRPSQSLSSSGILADYTTPGSMSPNSGFGSTQNVVLQQNRLNNQSQIVQRNRTSVKQMKQKSAAKKKFSSNTQGQYSDEEDDNDSPLSDNGHPPVPTRFSSYSHHHQ